jgi:hypothetical protein
MRKVSPGIAWCALLSVFALILGACIKPVSLGDFFEDEIVKGIIGIEEEPKEPEEGVEGEITYEHPEDHPPILRVGTTDLVEGDTVQASLTGTEVKIDAINMTDYTTGIVSWYYGDTLLGNSNVFRVNNPPTAPFDQEGIYHLVVVGIIDGVSYSTGIFIQVNP